MVFYLNFDGSCGPINPGGTAGYGYVLRYGNTVIEDRGIIGTGPEYSNNYAEFYALYKGLEKISEISESNPVSGASIRVYGDSKLVINIMNRKWRASNDKLYFPAYAYAELASVGLSLHDIKYIWIEREKNTVADKLSKVNQ